ncbi:MAG: hypothetical protein KF773_12520 [Deltaproteobacteria bacterium]|nr:hypothetical protein [Deltaproteobacteria bacterium]
MRDAKRLVRTPEAALDEVSDHLGEVLRRADDLLAEWSRFGEVVRRQVEREAADIGDAVAASVEVAAVRGVAASVDRALTEHVGTRLSALAGEIARLEARARAATRVVADERAVDRKVLWILGAGVLVANVLLAILLLRPAPEAQPAPAQPVPAQAPVEPAQAPPAEPAQAELELEHPAPHAAAEALADGEAHPRPAAIPVAPKTYGAPVKRN